MSASAQDLSIRQLQYVVAVAETRGFHRAAVQCGVSQPTLSAQVQKLEDVLGVRVFERDRRRVIITAAGAPIIALARKVLMDVDDLVLAAAKTADPLAGTVRLGVIPTVAPYLLPDVTPGLAARWPKLRLALVEQKTDELLAALRAGTLDAGLLALVDGMDDLAYAPVVEDPFVVAVPQAHRLAKKKTVSLADLEDEPVFLLEDGHCFRTQALALCARAGAAENDLRATSLATLVQMVSAGNGVTLLPSLAVDVENRRSQLAIRPLAGKGGAGEARTIVLAWRKTTPLAAGLGELAKAMAETAPKLS